MFRVSKDQPAYYLTSVAKDRLPVFRTEAMARAACAAIDEARSSGGFSIFSYMIMPDHLHVVTDSHLTTKETHRYINGIVSRRLIDHLKEGGYADSLKKLEIGELKRGYKYSLWQHHPDTRLLWSEDMLWQRIQYTHLNPIRAGLAEHPDDWPWSSSRIWHRRANENEPLAVDIDKVEWRR